ncbi:hypothetical protein ACFQE1_09280, partial [Halobium palmae]
ANGNDAAAAVPANADGNASGDDHPGSGVGERNSGAEDGNGDGAERKDADAAETERKVRDGTERKLGIGANDVRLAVAGERAGAR